MSDLKLALRTITRTPFITAIAVLSLALGIGANAAIFSLFDQMLLRSLPVYEPDRLVSLSAPGPMHGSTSCNQAGDCDIIFSYPMFRDLERDGAGFDGIAAHRLFRANIAATDMTMSGEGLLVSGSYFPVLGVQPALGRLFVPADDQNVGEHFVAVLSHNYWVTHLGGDRGILNQTIVVNGQPMTVVGVAAAGFEGTTLGADPDVFVPITMRPLLLPNWSGFDERRSYWIYLFGRLRPEGTIEQAQAEANTLFSSIINEVEAPLQEGMSESTLERFRAKALLVEDGSRGQSSLNLEAKTPLTLLFAITAVVLLIACANIANLLLARGANRAQEMAIRGSLGASRSQLLGQLLMESVLLATLGGIASLFVAHWTLGLIASRFPAEFTSSLELTLQPSVALFAGALALGTGVLFGMYPALHSTRPDLITMLRSAAGMPSGARAAARFRSSLVTAQIALSMALLVAAGLFIKSLTNISQIDLGLEAENLVAFGVSPQLNGYEPARSLEFFARMEEDLAAIPGVTGVTAALVPILTGSNWGTDVAVQGFESGPDIDSNARLNQVAPTYFSTMGIPLLAGREFTLSDAEGAPKVAIVNEAFTRKFGLDAREAVGTFMSSHGGIGTDLDMEIVGLVQDATYSDVKRGAPPLFFTPYRQNDGLGNLTFYVRTGMEPAPVMQAIPGVVSRLDANLPVERLKTLEQQVSESVVVDRLISSLAAAFAVLATLLAAVGLYGVLAYTVAQRTREIGLRMALGAGGHHVRNMVLRQVTRMTAVGGIIGVAVALGIGRFAQSLLFELDGNDPWVVASVVLVVAAVAFTAGYLPALRASKVDPMEALRYE